VKCHRARHGRRLADTAERVKPPEAKTTAASD